MSRPLLPFVLLALGSLCAPDGAAQITTELVVSGLTSPTALAAPLGDSERLFVALQGGRIRIVKNGALMPGSFLDISADVTTASQGGLISLCFHPDYNVNGWFYLYYLDGFDTVLARYTVSGDPDVADASSGVELLRISNPTPFHMGGGLDFGPDGKLYLAVGDQREVPGGTCTAQEGDTLVGKLVRLNDNGTIPADNPFVGNPSVLDEIMAFGLRMPYRIDFDDLTGDLYIAEVGEDTIEEVNAVPFAQLAELNFGWRVKEGTICTGNAACDAGTYPCPDPTLVEPAYQYLSQFPRCCVIGGVVYRGSAVPELDGTYVLSDWCSGEIISFQWSAALGATNVTDLTPVLDPGDLIDTVYAFGTDGLGELYIVDGGLGLPLNGEIYKVVAGAPPFQDLGGGLAGSNGTPELTAGGTLVAGTEVQLDLTRALGESTASLVLGVAAVNAPFKGGTLVPSPAFILGALPVNEDGTLPLVFPMPPGVPAGVETYWQYWIDDPAGPAGYAASNGLKMTTP